MNGKHKVEFIGEFSVVPSYEIEVQDSILMDMEYDIKRTYKINWKSKDKFQLKLIPTGNETIREVKPFFPMEYPYYEMTDHVKDTLFFNYYQGMGVSTVTGKFIWIRK